MTLIQGNAQPPADAQPEWMRSFQANQPYTQYPAQPPQQPPTPQPYQQYQGNPGNPGNQGYQGYQGYPGGAPGYPQQPGQPQISVGSLVNEDALPEWLRNAANSGALPPPMPQPQQNPPVLAGNGWENTRAGQPSLPPQAAQTSGPLGYGQQRPMIPPSPVGSGSLVASALFDESALPEWLRAGAMGQSADMPTNHMQAPAGYGAPPLPNQPGQPNQGPQPQIPVPPSSAFPGIEQAGAYQVSQSPQSGLPASSLIDANALPQWLSGQQGAPAAPQGRNYEVSRGLQAGSLIDENALPQWLRNEPPSPSPANQAPGVVPGMQGAIPPNTTQGPSWLNQGYAPPAPTPNAWSSMPNNGVTGQPMLPSQGGIPGMMGANELVDEAALPEWLRSQSGIMNVGSPLAPLVGQGNGANGAQPMQPMQPKQPAQPAAPPPNPQDAALLANGSAAGTFSASDLIDPSALPDWVRGANAAPAPTFS